MIDTATLVWGTVAAPSPRRAKAPFRRPSRSPLPIPFDYFADRYGSDDGQVREIRYKTGARPRGHWQAGALDFLYTQGRLELRASLPKLLTGRNDELLDEHAVHEGLRRMVALGSELADYPLALHDAEPSRLDYVYQWGADEGMLSVGHVIEHLKSYFKPARIQQETAEYQTPDGGHTWTVAKGSKRMVRFYDKVAELAARGEHSAHAIDTVLRYEVQDRRRERLRAIHHHGYTANAVRHELQRGIAGMTAIAIRDLRDMLAGCSSRAVAGKLATLWLVENDEAWPILRDVLEERTYRRWRRRARELGYSLAVADWTPTIPDDAFVTASSLWATERAA